MNKIYCIALIGIFNLISFQSFAQNPTDACGAGVQLLTSNGSCTSTAYSLPGSYSNGGVVNASCASGLNRDDGWYRFVATGTSTTVEVAGDEDRVVAIFSGSCGTGELACDAQNSGTIASATATTVVGTTYYVQVHRRSGNNTATMAGTICVYETPVVENSIHVDGTNDYVNCGNNASLNITGTAISIEAWIYPTSWKTNVWEGVVIGKIGAGDNGYMLRVGNSGQLNFNLGTGWWNEINAFGALSLNSWQHIAGTYDGTTMRLYVDGVEVANGAETSSVGSTSNNLFLGEDPKDNGRYFPGRIEEVRVWNVTRSVSEVVEDMNTMTCAPLPAGLVAYYRFNQGITAGANAGLTNVIDETGINNGTLTNSSLSGATSNWVAGLVRACPSNMTYTSSTTTQTETSSVCPGTNNQVIIGFEVVTTGSNNAIDLTQIQFNMNGTSNTADVTNVDVFYTGTSSTYSATGAFGNVAPGAGTLTVNGTQALSTGINYFWIAYDIAAGATATNILDARGVQITVDGSNYTPTVTDPSGSRTITTGGVDCPGFGGLDIGTINCAGSPYNYANNLTGANDDCTQRTGPDHMYTFTLTVAADVTITVCDPAYDGYVYLYNVNNGNCSGGFIASNDDSGCGSIITQNGLAAGTYVVLITTYGSSSPADGSYTLAIDVSNCQNSGDTPCDAIGMTVGCSGTKVLGNNTGMTNSGIAAPSCATYAGGDIWFALVVPASGVLKIENYTVTLTDVGMSVYSVTGGCSGTFTEISCDDNSGFGSMSEITLSGQTPGSTLYVRVWDNGNNQTGTFEIDAADLSSDYCVTGDGTDMGSGCAELTAAVNDELGSIWDADDKLSFTSSWSYDFTVNLGANDAGADGVCFVIQNDPGALTTTGTSGGAMGAGGITNSLIIEIDTYINTEDRNDGIGTVLCAGGGEPDHMDIWLNGDVNSGSSTGCPGPAGTRYIPNGVRLMNGGADYNIENGLDHILRVSYTLGTQTLTATTLNAAGTVTYGAVSYSPLDPMVVFGTNVPYFGFTASTGGLNNNQTACLPSSLVLPVELLAFDANCLSDKVELNWATASEINNDYFTIERSVDGINFEEIGELSGAGNSNQIVNYSWRDNNPLPGVNYYRLKQADFDGKFSYSFLKASDCKEVGGFSIYPNPVSNVVVLNSSSDVPVHYQITSIDGRVIEQGGFLNIKKVDLSKLSSGTYFVKAISRDKIFQEKLIKK